MDKMIVVVFDNEAKAYEGSKALRELQDEGSINIYAEAVISRDASGKVAVKQQGDMGPAGTAVGLFTGSLIGLLGGPLGLAIGGPVGLALGGSVGLAIGAGAGTDGGLLYDLAHLGISQDFLTDVEKSLLPGKAAVVAEVWEEWTLPVDTRMEALGGVVLRRTRREFIDTQIERDVTALKADIVDLEAEYDQATGEAAAKIQAKVDAAKARLQAAQDGVQARIEASQKEAEAKIMSLQEQADKARSERKAKLDKHIAELQAEQKRRSELLKQAWEHAKEALKD